MGLFSKLFRHNTSSFDDDDESESHGESESSSSLTNCRNCGLPLTGGEYVPAWEDGDNPYAYIECPYCHYANSLRGFDD